MKSLALAILPMALCALGRAVSGPELPSALATLEVCERPVTHAELSQAVRTIKARANVGDRTPWADLRHVIEDGKAPVRQREQALLLACEQADRNVAAEILDVMASIVRQLDRDRIRELSPEQVVSLGREARLTRVFLSEGFRNVETPRDPEPTLAFLVLVASRHAHPAGLNMPRLAMKAIAASEAPIELRRASALDVIRETPS